MVKKLVSNDIPMQSIMAEIAINILPFFALIYVLLRRINRFCFFTILKTLQFVNFFNWHQKDKKSKNLIIITVT